MAFTIASQKDTSQNPFLNMFHQKNKLNHTEMPTGFERRWGVGQTEHPPDTLDERRKPLMFIFLHFANDGGHAQLSYILENVTTMWLSKLRITGIVGTYDVIFLRFKGGSGNYTMRMLHNLQGVYEDVYPIMYNGATTTEVYYPPLLLGQNKSAITFSHFDVDILDINGNDVTFSDLYLQLCAECMNWQ